MKALAGTLAALSLSGCISLTASKSLIVTPEPGETKIAVTANAVTRCKDYFIFYRCTLNLDLKQDKPGQAEPVQPQKRRRQ